MTHLLYHQAGRVSGPRLAKFMGIEPAKSLGNDEPRPDFLIRYGSAARVPLRPKYGVINSRGALASLNGRQSQLNRLADAGVPVPEFGKYALSGWHTFLGRDEGDGRQTTKGRDIMAYDAHADGPRDHDFYVQYIPKERQFRVHVVMGSTRVRELVPENDEARSQVVWNYGNGFTFKVAQSEAPAALVPQATAAVAALKLDFGAVDVITLGDDVWVLEVNTAPGLADPTLEWYAEKLGPAVGLTVGDMPRWDAVQPQENENG